MIRLNRFQRTDLRRSVGSSWLIVAILILSFLGPLTSSLLRSSVEGFLSENSRRVLTADIAVTAYRPIRDDEADRLARKYGVAKRISEIEFVTMTTGNNDRTLLLEIHAVQAGFPIEGEFEFTDGKKSRATPTGNKVWLSNDALLALDLKEGDVIQLGKLKFPIEKSIRLAPGISRAAFGFAPRAYIPIELANQTGLLGFGSQVYFRNYFETSRPVLSTEEVRETLGDPDLFLRTPDDSVQGLERFTSFAALYLSIVSVSLFALGWAAAFYVVRTQAIERMRSAAISLVFGSTTHSVLWFEFFRIGILTLIAGAFALAIAYGAATAIEPMIAKKLAESVPGVFRIAVSWRDIAALAVTALASALLFTVPFANRLRSSKLVDLFQDSAVGVHEGARTRVNIATGFAAVSVLVALSMWLTRDAKLGLQLALGFVAAAAVIHFTGILAFRFIAKSFSQATGRFGSLLRLVGTQLSRARFAVRLSFLAIGLSTFVASAVGQIMVSLTRELTSGTKLENAPDFFLFNIPESDLESLQLTLAKENSPLNFVSPMILARLKTVNDQPTDNEQFQKFPLRITWREKPIASEKVVSGLPLAARFSGEVGVLPGISVEAKFADRNGFKLGDRLMFDVQGVPIEGRIENFRRVRWTDFNPNFFISFQGGVLEDAPKTWLGNVRVGDRAARSRVQSEIVRAYPDLSLIDVSQTLERVVGLTKAILGPAEQAAVLSIVFSILVLLTIVAHSTVLRRSEMNLFRILGAAPRRVKNLYRLEFALASGLGSFSGAACGCLLAWFVATRFLELEYVLDSPRLFATIAGGLILGTSLGEWLFHRVSRQLGNAARVV